MDIGQARVGIAVSDATGKLACPVCVLDASAVLSHGPAFRRVLEDWEPDVLVCGLPKTLSGELGPQAEHVMSLAQQISQSCALPLEFVDERLSSQEAKRILKEQGLSEKNMRGKVDMIAASLFLQSWLDASANRREETL